MSYAERVRGAKPSLADMMVVLAEGIDEILMSRRPAPKARIQECPSPLQPRAVESTDVRQVFTEWQRIMRRPRATLTEQRRRAIQTRLKEGYPADRIVRAIRGCAGSDFHMARGQYKGQSQYNDLTLICRNATKLEEFEQMPVAEETDVVLRALRAAAATLNDHERAHPHVAISNALPTEHRSGNHKIHAYRLLREAGTIAKAIELREQELNRADADAA
jgi:hypothetical protein